VRSSLALLLAAGVAHADPPKQDPRDLFGLNKQDAQAALDCSDGREWGCATATDPFADRVPYALDQWLPASYLLKLPIADATQDQVAPFALGVGRDDAGITCGGSNGLENRWLIDGAPSDDLRTGGVGTRVPVTFLDGLHVTAGGFAARDRASTGCIVDTVLKGGTKDHQLDAYAWATYTLPGSDRPIANASYQVRRLRLLGGPDFTMSVVGTGPIGDLVGGSAWYAAGIAPNIGATRLRWRASRLVDADNDGIPDGYPGQLTLDPIETNRKVVAQYFVPLMARVGWDRGVHHVDFTLVGDYSAGQRLLANSTLQAAGIDRTDWVGDGIATWRGEWTDTHARIQLSWHRSVHDESASDPAAAKIPQLLTAYVPTTLSEDPTLATACDDTPGVDAFPNIPNCPVPLGFFASGGAGQLQRIVGDRPTVTGDIAHREGDHMLRAGATFEDTRLVTTTRFTGNEEVFSLFDGEINERRFIRDASSCPMDPAQPCSYLDSSELNWRTRYTAAYVEDTWTPGHNITVDAGLRWELMWVGTRLHFSDELSPRVGASWDFRGDGTSRVWLSFGRSFVMLPAGLGAAVISQNTFVDDTTVVGGHGRNIDIGAAFRVAPGIEPMSQNELTAGAEVSLQRAVKFTGWIDGRWLDNGIDTAPNGFDNPGRDGSLPAERSSVTVAGEIATSPTRQLVLRIGYSYNYTVGSWSGAFDPRQGAVLYTGTDFDFTSVNQLGRLPTDGGHRLYIEGIKLGTLLDIPVNLATRLTLASGTPRNVLANSDFGIVEMLPRGSAGRWPLVTQTNVRLGARWRCIDWTLDVFNVFYRQQATLFDEIYTGSAGVTPIVGGDERDLIFAKNDIGQPITRRPAYNLPLAFQPATSFVLGAKRSF
jgi:hypothetical protein